MNSQCKILIFIFLVTFFGIHSNAQSAEEQAIKKENVTASEKLIGLEFSDTERDSMLDDLNDNLESYQKLRGLSINNGIPPALNFNPVPVDWTYSKKKNQLKLSPPVNVEVPDDFEDLAFYSVRDLGVLISTGKITSVQLTEMYLARLRKYDPQLHCVITLTEELAMEQARHADQEIVNGKYRGPLHGIPYGAKDLLAVKGYKTTWGATPYKDQYIDKNATIIEKLEEAGAILVAKLTLGALAWGDVWFSGKTRNPWNLEQGSSGSSAGSASAVSAGLVAFAIGSETWGSIVSPSTRCGTTGLRPTFGMISRTGAMALSWSMDKIGPICRTVEDCAIVFETIRGGDGIDKTVKDFPFSYDSKIDLKGLRIGYLESQFEEDSTFRKTNDAALTKLSEMGISLKPIELPEFPIYSMSFILSAEAAAAFDEITRSGKDSMLVRQIKNAWPNVFRVSRFIPAVEYIQANRVRYQLIQEMEKMMKEIDVYVAPSFGENLLLTNLTGHPCVVVPNGFDEEGSPTSISFIGRLYDEGTLLAFVKTYQDATENHKKHPPLFSGVN
jgi:Asp-tRNA(Asn)/Glu-tRNA(Gln) amidotransferase A subunit family amidase